jgi:hypothetical protein
VRRRRTIYFEDGRHYYLYNFEPPISLEDARMPVDQIAGTAVDTFIYGVACRGLFYPSKVGMLFCDGDRPFTKEYETAFWRALTNLKSLIQRGLDPLKLLIDRAHEKDIDFIASLRMGDYPEMDPNHLVANGGRGLAHDEVRDFLFAILEELTTNYDIQGIELDFSAWPAIDWFFRPEEARDNAAMLTDWVARIADLVRKSDPSRTIGARILPHEAMNSERGLDVRDWLERGLLDFVVPVCYHPSVLDQDLPLDWIVEAAHASDVSVYGFLHPDQVDGTRQFDPRKYATTEMMRAAAANYVDRGVDGLYTWFLPWPFGGEQRAWLTEMGDWTALKRGAKHYVLRRRHPDATEIGYDAPLPVQIPFGHPGQLHEIPFYVSDDLEAEAHRVQRVTLRMNIADTVSADRLTLLLNGVSLEGERCVRSMCTVLEPYKGIWLEFDLVRVRPRQGRNVLALSLDERPLDLECDIRVDDVEIRIEYGPYTASGPGD